jgi:HAD superfamily hydrolase (TIGR01490 family)
MTAAAFFDVDGTLVAGTSIFRFLRYYLAREGHGEGAYAEHLESLRRMRTAGVPRTETNRTHYTVYKGAEVAAVAACAREWLRAELAAGPLFNPAALAAAEAHRADGATVVLVSGSFPALLEPLRELVGADHVLCTELATDGDVYTGELAAGPHQPMIGEAKAAAVRELATVHGIDLAASIAYGDHESDLPLMEATGAAVVVGEDERMERRARERGWRRLPGAQEPPPLPL